MDDKSVVDQATKPKPSGTHKRWKCPECQGALKKIFSAKRDKYYWFCDEASGCGKWYSDRDGEPVLRPVTRSAPVPEVVCPECGAAMVWVQGGKYGPFWSCSRYEAGCKGTRDCLDPERGATPANITPDCPSDPAHGPMRRRDGGRNGAFLGCRKYPECDATEEIGDPWDD